MPTVAYPDLVIGITVRSGDAEWVQKSTKNYLNILAEYNVNSVILAPDTPANLPDGTSFTPDALGRLPASILEQLDGLVLSGGGDVDPRYFGEPLAGAEEESIDHPRDELEIHLGRAALDADLPIFGICRGCQVLNVAAGGKMVQHFDNHRSAPDATRFHDVTFVEDGKLAQIVGKPRLQVNTFHHQGIDLKSLAPIMRATAFAMPDEWLVEAYESPQHQWVFGVQWHPERIFELDEGHRRIWESFLAAAEQHKRTRSQHS
jgi:putative glutamine amidotransferase